MSTDNHVLGISTAVGGGSAGIAAAAHSSHVLLIGIGVGLVAVIILGFVARRFNVRTGEQ